MNRILGWIAFFILASPFILLGLYEIGCAIEALREARIEQRDPQDRWTT